MSEQTGNAPVALAAPRPEAPDEGGYKLLMTQASHAVQSGLLPKGIDTPQKAIVILRKGRELGVGDMYALSHIAVIGGKPVASAEMMLALIYRAYGGNAIRVVKTNRETCVVKAKRPEWDGPMEIEFSMEDAKRAQLLDRSDSNWKKYPAHMLRWRAISTAAKLAFPEVLGGLYTAEEMGAPVVIDASGEAWIDAEASEPQARLVDTETGEIIETHASAVDEPATRNVETIEPGKGRARLLESVVGICGQVAALRDKNEKPPTILRAGCNALGIDAKSTDELGVNELSAVLNWATTQRDLLQNSATESPTADESVTEIVL